MIDMFDGDLPLFNAFLRINHPWTAEMIAKSSFDLITFDLPHGMIERSLLDQVSLDRGLDMIFISRQDRVTIDLKH